MQITLFTIPAVDSNLFCAEMNAFLRGHKIIDIDKQFYSNETGAFWSFCVRYVLSTNTSEAFTNVRREKVDYKSVLDEKTFERFSKFRETRKKIAQGEAIPAYAVFTDYELSEIAKLGTITIKSMSSIKGVGTKKIEKYGKYFEEPPTGTNKP